MSQLTSNSVLRKWALAALVGALLAVAGMAAPAGPAPAEASGAAAVTASSQHSCAITTVGGVKCWGDNSFGQLGDGTNTDTNGPVDVVGLTTGVTAVDARGPQTCALTTVGAVKCWGANSAGQLGDGTNTDSNVPVDVVGLTTGVAAVRTGAQSCAITTAGGMKCWGYNAFGKLGDGTNTDSNVPVDVSGLTSGVAAMNIGFQHTCALTTGGGIKCWGANAFGQLGDGTNTDSNVPVDVSGLTSGAAAIETGGLHTCALTTAGGVKCWGLNFNGQLGDGTNTTTNLPVDVSGLSTGAVSISKGANHSCAETNAGGFKCWGSNSAGQLGDGTNTDSNVPVDVSVLASGVAALDGGADHTCALTTGGDVKCWGLNVDGQLGDCTNTDSLVPVDVLLDGCPGTPVPPTDTSVPPTVTPTITPTPAPPVGGIALDADLRGVPLKTSESASTVWIFVALAAATSVLALSGTAWYARRRWR